MDRSDETTKDHVYRGGIEGGSDEDENRLDDEAANGEFVVVAPDTAGIAYCLDWIAQVSRLN